MPRKAVWTIVALILLGAGLLGLWRARTPAGSPLGAAPATDGASAPPPTAAELWPRTSVPSQPPPAAFVAAINLGNAKLVSHRLTPQDTRALAHDTALALASLLDETSISYEAHALQRGLRLPDGLAAGSSEQRQIYWASTTGYLRDLDIEVASIVVRVRTFKGRDAEGPQVGRAMLVRTVAKDEVRTDKPLYELVFTGVGRSGDLAGQRIRFGLLMVRDVPDGSWRPCAICHYDVPEGKPRPMLPVAYPSTP